MSSTLELTQHIPSSGIPVEHAGPHILPSKGSIIEGWDIFGLHITNTIFSTWIFIAVLFVIIAFFSIAIRTERLPRLRTF